MFGTKENRTSDVWLVPEDGKMIVGKVGIQGLSVMRVDGGIARWYAGGHQLVRRFGILHSPDTTLHLHQTQSHDQGSRTRSHRLSSRYLMGINAHYAPCPSIDDEFWHDVRRTRS